LALVGQEWQQIKQLLRLRVLTLFFQQSLLKVAVAVADTTITLQIHNLEEMVAQVEELGAITQAQTHSQAQESLGRVIAEALVATSLRLMVKVLVAVAVLVQSAQQA
jgi:hypothetical protein